MFIKINNFRFRITSISEYRKEGKKLQYENVVYLH